MSLINENGSGMVMPVGPMYGGGGGGYGADSWGGGGFFWLLVIFVIAAMSGNGFGFGGGFGGNGAGTMMVNNDVQRGFDQQAIMGGINGVNTGLNTLGMQVCNGFNAAEQAAATRQMMGMQNDFAMQTAMNQGFNGLQSSFSNCCCENRLGLANLSADIARENCADRQATTDAMVAISNKIDALGNQILTMNYQNQLAAKDDIIAQLRSEALYNRGQASQDVQTATIQAGQRALATEIEQYVNPVPVPAYPACGYNNGCNQNRFVA